MYKELKDMQGNLRNDAIIRLSDEAFIPFDEENKDYQEYLKWIDLGNIPESA